VNSLPTEGREEVHAAGAGAERQRSGGDGIEAEKSSRSLDIQGEDRENKQNKFCKKYLL
jgi:hypothetical protein